MTYFDDPTGVSPEADTKHKVRVDARQRSVRTLLQGAVVAVLLAVAGVTTEVLGSGALPDWAAYGALVLQAGGAALASYVHRVLSGESLE